MHQSPSRCARDLKGRFGSEAGAAEELIAELGAAFLCADLALASEPRPDHAAAYVSSSLKVLKNDKRAIFTAAAHWAALRGLAALAVGWPPRDGRGGQGCGQTRLTR